MNIQNWLNIIQEYIYKSQELNDDTFDNLGAFLNYYNDKSKSLSLNICKALRKETSNYNYDLELLEEFIEDFNTNRFSIVKDEFVFNDVISIIVKIPYFNSTFEISSYYNSWNDDDWQAPKICEVFPYVNISVDYTKDRDNSILNRTSNELIDILNKTLNKLNHEN